MSEAKPIPDGFNTVSVYIVVNNSVEALEFYARAFGAKPGMRMPGPDGKKTMHAEMQVGNSMVMLTDENPQWKMRSPHSLGGSPSSLHLYVEDADSLFNQAVKAGCAVIFPMEDTFWGDRYGKVRDPFGHEWGIATHKVDLSPQELETRQGEFFARMRGGEEGA